jgi:glutathione synthase/RimK-type ligase-like ATP-grasp enzyme
VHVIDDTTIATVIKSEATDYRYAGKQVGADAELEHIELKATNKRKCIHFSKHLGLFFSGIDFKKNTSEELCCFEANPMPGYSYYEQSASQPIAYTLACALKKIDEAFTSA